jgi:hypothetical protein
MKRLFVLLLLVFPALTSGQDLHTFSNGEVADADVLNENLSLLLGKIDVLEKRVAAVEPEPEPESQLPFPTGRCSGLIPLDSSQVAGNGGGASSISVVLDFDDQSAHGVIIYFSPEGPDGEDRLEAQWSLDQDGSGIALDIARDELLPASFITSLTLELSPDDSDERDLKGLQPTGNEFVPFEVVLRLLPTAGGARYIIQGVNITHNGFCDAL